MQVSRKAVMAQVCLLFLAATSAGAFSGGVTTANFSNPASGCGSPGCHNGGLAPVVTVSGPTSVTPSSVNEYLVTVFEIGTQANAGLNASADVGTLSVGGVAASGTQGLSGEITHNGPKAAVAGAATFSFLWQAPAAGSATIQVWGNAVNLNGNQLGDAATLSSVGVTVAPAPTPSPTPSPTPTPAPTETPLPPAAVPSMSGLGAWLFALLLFAAGSSILRRRMGDG